MNTLTRKPKLLKGNDIGRTRFLLDLIVDPNKSNNLCFLCFKVCETKTLLQVQKSLEIHDVDYSCRTSLANMFEELFGGHDYVTDQVCETCSTIILNIYTVLKRYKAQIDLLRSIIKHIDDNIDSKEKVALIGERSCKIIIKAYNETNNLDDTDVAIKLNEDTEVSPISNGDKKCNKCQMTFTDNSKLQKHKKISHHTLNRANICDICGKEYKSSSALKLHLTGHKIQQCPYCDKVLKINSHYRFHLSKHLTEAKTERRNIIYKCNDCHYESKNKKSLEAHMNKVHLNIRPFVCEECQKGFYRLSNLKEHSLIHREIERTCHVCGEGFSTNKCLMEHLMLHTGLKNYQCEMCGNRFVSATRKNEHVKRKHGDRCEVCELCGKKYSLKKDLNRHFKMVHSENNYWWEKNKGWELTQIFLLVPCAWC